MIYQLFYLMIIMIHLANTSTVYVYVFKPLGSALPIAVIQEEIGHEVVSAFRYVFIQMCFTMHTVLLAKIYI